MCGIAGIWHPQTSHEGRVVRQMVDSLSHRGPDDNGIFRDNLVAMGHRRLAILDCTSAGHQPMAALDGRVQLVFNGEIYNFRTLRSQLESHGDVFRSASDTEVVLRAYLRWGDSFVDRLVGDFAFAIYDSRRPGLLLARDRFGVKPLYFARQGSRVIFASEIRAILASGHISAELNESRISEFLALQSVSPPETLVDGIKMLEPGAVMRVDDDGVSIHTYWNLADYAAKPVADEPEAIKRELKKRLITAVDRQMISDVPLGAFLSGGIDSSVVVGLMSRLSERPVETIAVAFDDAGFDDGHFARIAAAEFGTDHIEVNLSDDELVEHVFDALQHQDHPSADGINTYIVSEAARRRGLTVALSGLGGDELFAGYSNFGRLAGFRRFQTAFRSVPAPVRQAFASLLDGRHRPIAAKKLAALARTDGSLAQAYPVVRHSFFRDQRRHLLRHPNEDTLPITQHLRQAFFGRPHIPLLSQISCAETAGYMHDILLRDTDQMSMAHGLEVRVPLLDHALAEYVIRVPDSVKEPTDAPKQLMVDALDGLLPDQIIHRPKQGFRMPFDRWLRGPLKQGCQANLARVANLSCFHGEAVFELWDDFVDEHASVSWSRIWLLNCLGAWMGHTLESAGRQSSPRSTMM